jgi:uncharacterized protein (DUF1697 family)
VAEFVCADRGGYVRGVRQVVLLRGINLGPRNRIPMAKLRERLAQHGFDDVSTYLQSGNVVLSSRDRPEKLADAVRRLISDTFGLEIAVVVRTREELAEIVRRNPLKRVADNPKRYQVTFLGQELSAGTVEELCALATGSERLVAVGRELYAWHPEGVARSKLWNRLAGSGLGTVATARNWTTVTKLLDLADG